MKKWKFLSLLSTSLASSLSSESFALPATMTCGIFTPVTSGYLEFDQPLNGQTKEVFFTTPHQKEYRLQIEYNKSVSNLNVNVEVPKIGGYVEILHTYSPVTEKNGAINQTNIHLSGEILDGEALVIECPK